MVSRCTGGFKYKVAYNEDNLEHRKPVFYLAVDADVGHANGECHDYENDDPQC